MELTPDTFTVSVCLIREVTPPKETNGYPYRDVTLVSDPVSHTMRFPEYPASTFQISQLGVDPDLAEEIHSNREKQLRVFLVKGDAPPSPDPAIPVVFRAEDTFIRVLLSEVASGKCCHATIHPEVRDLFFPKPDTDTTDTTDAIRDVPTSGYNPADRGRLTSPMSLVRKEDGGYHPLPLIGYHGTSEVFIPDILTGGGLRKTTEYGLYGNNAYYFGSFDKAIRYAFRDSGYNTIGETAPLRTSKSPGGFLRVPGTRHRESGKKGMYEDLIRDSPAMVRFVLFPENTVRFPEGEPVKTLPPHGTPKGGLGYDVDTGNRFLRFTNTPGEISSKDEDAIQQRVEASMETPLFGEGYMSSSAGIGETDPVIPVPPPTDIANRQTATLMSYLRTHVATRTPSTDTDLPSVILLREPGVLPELADFFLMTSGFLTQTEGGIAGDTITHINEDEIRELTTETQLALGGGEGGDADGTRPRPFGSLGSMTDYRVLMEDIVSVSPTDSPVLLSCATLTPESLVRIRENLTNKSGRPVLVIRATGGAKGSGGKDHDMASPHAYTQEELTAIRLNLDTVASTLGGVTETITYTPPKSNLFGKGIVTARDSESGPVRVCSLRMDHTTAYVKGKRLMHNRSVHATAYLKEYPTGGSYRVYKLVRNPDKVPSQEQIRALKETLRGQGWSPEDRGTSDTLVIQPFAYETPGSRGKTTLRSLTQHTEIVVAGSSGDEPPRFLPLTWHRGDQRTVFRHHHPMDTGMRVI